MIVHEDCELESAALGGELCLCVPVSVYLAADSDKAVITSYENVWDICTEYEEKYGDAPFSDEGLLFLENRVAPEIGKCGYLCDRKEHRVINEYMAAAVTKEMRKCSETAVIINSPEEIPELPCLCLHKPEVTSDDDYGVCAVVISDGFVCSVAGVNDMFTDDTAEIYVETAKGFRGRGFGKAAAASLAKYLIERGCVVGYKCAADNTASVCIAEKLGMTYTGKRFDMVCYAEE